MSADDHGKAVSNQALSGSGPNQPDLMARAPRPDRDPNDDLDSGHTIEARVDTPTRLRRRSEEATLLLPGCKLGSFRILQHIASGGMGQVYRANDERLDRDVAIKILPTAFASDPVLMSRFQAEARAASALNHPNIVAIHDIGREADLCWIVSELVEGHSLRWFLNSGPITTRRVIEIGSQIAEGLAAAHAAGFIHRDLKPENVMLTREYRVKILDFGLVKSAVRKTSHAANTTNTQAGVVVGTPGYMSPEHIVGGPVDQRSDIFSLGVILYEMLAHQRPFTATDRMTVMKATLTAEPAPLPPQVPLELARITMRCLEKEPERRMQSASDVAFALQMAPGSSSQDLLVPPRKAARRIPTVALTISAAMVVATAVFWAGLKLQPTAAPRYGAMHRLTWDNALISNSAISPDGKLVAYASDRENGRDLNIYVQQIDGGTLQLTKDSEGNDEPTFSPDGSRIAFESRLGVGGIHEIPALGGKARLMVAGGRHPRYSPDGRFLLYAKVGSEANMYGGWGTELLVQPISGGTPTVITQGCTHAVAEAVWSPDSQRIMASATCDGKLGLWLLNRDGKTRQQTNGAELWTRRGLNSALGLAFQRLDQWLDNPPRILLPLAEGDIRYETAVPLSRDSMRLLEPFHPIEFGPGIVVQASASVDGRTAFTTYDRSVNVWELPIDAAGHRNGDPKQITSSKAILVQPALSRDGHNVAFVLTHAGRNELQVLNLRSQAVTTLNVQPGLLRHPTFSPDGSSIDYETEDGALEVGIGGGTATDIYPGADGYVADWSPDGRQFLWQGRTPDQPAISLGDRTTSKMIPILNLPGGHVYQPRFSPDGKYVTFNADLNQHSRIYAAPLRNELIPVKEWIPLTDGTSWDDKPRISADGKILFFISDRDGFTCIWLQRITADMRLVGRPEEVFSSHQWRRALSGAGLGDIELNVAKDKLLFTQAETLGNVWILDPQPKGN